MADNQFQWCQVFSTNNYVEAHIVEGLFQQAGIQVQLKGAELQGALGELPFEQTQLSLWVYQIKLRQAEQILVNYQQQTKTTVWFCNHCGEENGPAFEYCWQCGRQNE